MRVLLISLIILCACSSERDASTKEDVSGWLVGDGSSEETTRARFGGRGEKMDEIEESKPTNSPIAFGRSEAETEETTASIEQKTNVVEGGSEMLKHLQDTKQ